MDKPRGGPSICPSCPLQNKNEAQVGFHATHQVPALLYSRAASSLAQQGLPTALAMIARAQALLCRSGCTRQALMLPAAVFNVQCCSSCPDRAPPHFRHRAGGGHAGGGGRPEQPGRCGQQPARGQGGPAAQGPALPQGPRLCGQEGSQTRGHGQPLLMSWTLAHALASPCIYEGASTESRV